MNRARIGVDVRGLADPITGTGVVVRELLRRLDGLDRFEFVGYATRPVAEGSLPPSVPLRLGSGLSARWGSVWMQTSLGRLLARDQIDLFWGPLQVLPLRAERGLPMVLTLHDLVFRFFPETMSLRNRVLLPRLVPPSLRRADLVTVVSETTGRDAVRELGADAAKIRVVTNGVADHFEASAEETASQRLLFVGTREPRKNLEALLEALRRLLDQGRWQGELALVGLDGWGSNADIDARLRKLGERCQVSFLGYVGESELPEIYRSSRLLVMPSLYEGFGLPVLEAMASGLVVACSDAAPFPEITDGAALLAPPRDVDALAQQIERAWGDEALRAELRERGLDVARRYSWQRSAEKLADVFDEVLSRRS
ncbi:MAG: glycosyltransferase family 1 protein [Acidobacteriota bacterium]